MSNKKESRYPFGKSYYMVIIVFLLILALVVGCTSNSNSNSEPTDVAESEQVEEPTEEPVEEPTEETMEEPTEEIVEEPTEEPLEEPTEESTEEQVMDEGPLYGGTLVVSRWPDLLSCNPSSSFGTDITVSEIMGNIFDPLIRPNAAGEMQPQLAESWEVSDDGLTITWNLRDDVFWHDGEQFTSEDVKFTFEGAISTDHPRGSQVYDALDFVETPDDFTAIFHMVEPRAAALFAAHGSEGLIIPEHIYADEDLVEGPHATCQELPIGTGPFKAVEYIPADRFVIERNPDWWGREGDYWGVGQPYLDRVIFTFIADVTARVNCLESGECDYVGMQQLPNNEVERFKAMEGRDVQLACTTQALGIQNLYGFNLRTEGAPWTDVRVRQAISYAIDRDTINERVYFGTGSVTSTFAPPGTPWYTDTVVEYKQDLDLANELLDDAGYPRGDDGTRFEVVVTHDTRPTHTDLANYLQQALEEVGIKVTIETLDFSAWVEKVHIEQDFEMMVSILGVGDPAVGVSRLFRSDNAEPAPFNNSSGYMDDEMDALWADFATTFDFKERQAIMSEIQAKITSDLPYIYVMSTNYPLGINTAEFAGYPTDCGRGDDLLRTIWWKEGSPEP